MPYGFESLIAFLQALVFTVPICGYLNDALHMHPQKFRDWYKTRHFRTRQCTSWNVAAV